MMLVIDVSHWQPDITWPTLAEAGVGAAIIKATQGNYILDAKLEAHVAGAKSVGMAAGCYMWNDPLVSATAQADFFWNNVNLKPFDFLAIDVEQWWADWAKWSAWNRDRTRPLPPQLSAQRITESALTVLGILKGRTEKPVIMYTRATFMQQYAPALIAKTNTMQMWWAQWPYAGGRVITSWEAFLENWLPPPLPGFRITGPAPVTGASGSFPVTSLCYPDSEATRRSWISSTEPRSNSRIGW